MKRMLFNATQAEELRVAIVDGQNLRIPLPELNEERRKSLVKVAHDYAEKAKVAIRHVRRDGMDGLKDLEAYAPLHAARGDALFRLERWREADQANGTATERLATSEQIVAAESDPDFIGALNAGASELRLLLLHNNLGGKSLSGAQFTTSATDGSATQRQPKLYQPSGKKLASYLRTTADLLKLRERCEADDELAQHLVLRFGTKKIRWSDFFFEKNRYEDAWRMQQRLGSECHPFAVVGTVDRVYVPDEGSGRVMSYLNLTAKYERPDAENVTSVFKVSVGDKDSEWLQTLGKGTEVIVFGVWSSGSPEKRASGSKIYLNHTLTLYTKFKEQLVVVALLP